MTESWVTSNKNHRICGSWGSSWIILAQLRQLLQDLRVAMVSTGKAPSCHLLEQSATGSGRVPSLLFSPSWRSAHVSRVMWEEKSSKKKTRTSKYIQDHPKKPLTSPMAPWDLQQPSWSVEPSVRWWTGPWRLGEYPWPSRGWRAHKQPLKKANNATW